MNLGKVAVTGGAGFLGSQLVRRLLPISEHVYIIDDLSTGNRNAVPKSEKVTFFEESITNEKVLEEVLTKVEYIFHFACKNLVLSVENMNDDFDTNLYGGYLLLQKAQKYCKGLKRFVYASTTSIYSEAPVLPTPESYHNIKLPYAASKFSMEHYCQVYHEMYQMPISILRFSNVYGPGQLATNPYCGVVAKFFEAIDNQEPMIIYGDGKQTRDFTYVEDAMDAVLLATIDEKAVGTVFNVGTGLETSVLELANVVHAECGESEILLQFEPKRKVDVVERRCINSNKIQKELQWQVSHPLKAGISKTFIWMKEGENRST